MRIAATNAPQPIEVQTDPTELPQKLNTNTFGQQVYTNAKTRTLRSE